MKYIYSLLLLFYFGTSGFGQFYIDTLSYQNDSSNGTKNFVAFADSSHIYIFGENNYRKGYLEDVNPYWAKYNYSGDIIKVVNRSTFSDGGIYSRTQVLCKKKDNRYYVFNEENFHDNAALRIGELDMVTGRTIRNRQLADMHLTSGGFDGWNTLYALGYEDGYDANSNRYVTSDIIQTYDTNFILKSLVKLWYGNYDVKVNSVFNSIDLIQDSVFEILGMNLRYASNRDKLDTIGIHRWIFDTNGKQLHKSVIPEGYGSVFSGHAALITANSGQRIMGLCKYNFNEDTDTWENDLNIAAYSSGFDSLLWSTHLFSTRDDKNRFTEIRAVCASYNQNGYVAMSDWTDTLSNQRQGQIFKVSKTGDLLWKRSITPSSYNANEAKSLRFNNISSTPYGYLIIGDYYVKNEGTKSFMMHTDQYGCLVPGCQRTVGSEDIQKDDEWAFEMYPNPVQSQLYILSKINSRKKHIINLYNMKGDELLQSEFYPQQNSQIMLLLPENIESGMHVLVIHDEKGKSVWRKSVIVQ